MLPRFTNLPDWAAWLAQDADGTWWTYEVCPNQHDSGWYENELGRCARHCQDTPNPDWMHSLRRIDAPRLDSTQGSIAHIHTPA